MGVNRVTVALSVCVAVLGAMSGVGNAQISTRWLARGVHF
jgi:hypothetical protein